MSLSPTKQTTGPLPAYQEARREKIIYAARKLLEKDDFDKIQIRDVAAKANVALGTLYRYFNSKEHLYAAVLYQWALPFVSNDESWDDLSDIDRLTKRVDRAMDAFDRSPQFFKVSLMLQQSTDPNAQELTLKNGDILDHAVMADLSALGERESGDVASMIWGTLLHMFVGVANERSTLADTRRTMSTLIQMVRAHYEKVGTTTRAEASAEGASPSVVE